MKLLNLFKRCSPSRKDLLTLVEAQDRLIKKLNRELRILAVYPDSYDAEQIRQYQIMCQQTEDMVWYGDCHHEIVRDMEKSQENPE